MKANNLFWGLILIVIGGLGVLSSIFGINVFNYDSFWPLFLLVPGLCFEIAYFSTRRSPGILVPGGILTTLGILFIFETSTNWIFSEYTWPIYPLAVAIGLFQLYLFGGREKGLLIPVGILTIVAGVSFTTQMFGTVFSWVSSSSIISILMVLLGVVIIVRNITKRD